MSFKGYMQTQLRTVGTDRARTFFTEDWADPKKRNKILRRPRNYSITIHMFNTAGAEAVETIPLPFKGNKDALSNHIKKQIIRMQEENKFQELDMIASFVCIRA